MVRSVVRDIDRHSPNHRSLTRRELLISTGLLTLFHYGCGKPSRPGPGANPEIRLNHQQTLDKALKEMGFPIGAPLFIRIFKETKELEVWLKDEDRFRRFRTYEICHFSGVLGPKLKKGDRQAPEGFYSVSPGRMNPNSRYHLSFNIGYPNEYDKVHDRTGSLIMVHGDCVSIGCFAMGDEQIEEIYSLAAAAFRAGQPSFHVHIFPFRMTEENLENHESSPWLRFWLNLKEGYDLFEAHKTPPEVSVEEGKYFFRLRI